MSDAPLPTIDDIADPPTQSVVQTLLNKTPDLDMLVFDYGSSVSLRNPRTGRLIYVIRGHIFARGDAKDIEG